jgi:ceramide glucosyltransferase
MPPIHRLLALLGLASLSFAALYAVVTVVAVVVWQRTRPGSQAVRLPPVTILKPLCGAEPGLYAHLRSFCQLDYPEYQIVFGVRDPADPALAVVERLVREFPALPIDIVVDPAQHGTNLKISSLINMLGRARHELLAMADSDTFVRSDYLRTVTAPLLDPKVGLVTCLYRGVPTRRIWSRLGAMYINEWYMPSVLLAWLFGHQGYVSGQTLCLRRETLTAIGGLWPIVNHLADDHRLGELIRGQGLRIVLSTYVLNAEHHEPTLDSLTRHELRWMRTLRALRPRSFSMIFVTFSLPVAVLGGLCAATEATLATTAWALLATTIVARLVVYISHRIGDERALLSDLWLLPLRDLLLCWVWCQSLFTSRITWRGTEFAVDDNGVLRRLS